MDAFVNEFLHRNVEELTHASGADQRTHFVEESCLNRFREESDADVSAAKLLSRDLLYLPAHTCFVGSLSSPIDDGSGRMGDEPAAPGSEGIIVSSHTPVV